MLSHVPFLFSKFFHHPALFYIYFTFMTCLLASQAALCFLPQRGNCRIMARGRVEIAFSNNVSNTKGKLINTAGWRCLPVLSFLSRSSLGFYSIPLCLPMSSSLLPRLHMFVSVGLSRPVNLSAVSERRALCIFPLLFFLFLFFYPTPTSALLLCAINTNPYALFLTYTHRQTHSLTLCLMHILSPSRSFILSEPGTCTHTVYHAVCQKKNNTLLHKADGGGGERGATVRAFRRERVGTKHKAGQGALAEIKLPQSVCLATRTSSDTGRLRFAPLTSFASLQVYAWVWIKCQSSMHTFDRDSLETSGALCAFFAGDTHTHKQLDRVRVKQTKGKNIA